MMRVFAIFVTFLLISATVYSQAFFELTETFVSSDASIQFKFPEQFNTTIDPDNQMVTVTGINELEFNIYSPVTLDLLGFADDLTHEELIEEFLVDYDDIGTIRMQRVESQDFWSATYDDGQHIILVVPLGNAYAIVESVEWVRSRHLIILLSMSASIELLGPAGTGNTEFSQMIVSPETRLLFELPSALTVEYLPDDLALELDSDDIKLHVFSTERIQQEGLGDISDAVELLSSLIDVNDREVGSIETFTVNRKLLTVADYTLDDFDGMLVVVPLDNGEFVVIDTIEWSLVEDRGTVIDIAGTFQAMIAPILNDPNGNWQDVIVQLEEYDVIVPGGGIVFVEDRAFFAGEGNWFTPLADNSPQTNIVMAATLSYTASSTYNLAGIESCTLLSRIGQNSVGDAIQFIQVGIDNFETVFYRFVDDNDEFHYNEFASVDLENNTTYHILYIAQEESLTVFLDGKQVAKDLPVGFAVGTFGIGLDSSGPTAECIGENIWVYRLPEVTDGVCRANSTANVNRRGGPGTSFAIAGQMTANSPEDIVGQTVGDDGFVWWQLASESWVRNDVISLSGDCSDVPDVSDN